jgi:ParB family chromosome partitioning protein
VSPPQRGMGRGLAAILAVSGGRGPALEDLRMVPVDLVVPNPKQPRRAFDEGALEALAGSLRERGILQPVLVRPVAGGTYELVAGERRWRAARIAGLETIPALVRERDDAEALEAALVENMAREDLNPVEEARACAALVEELGLTRETVGLRVGRSRVAVSNLLRLLDLPDEALALIERGELSEGHGRALLLATDHADRRRLARSAFAGGWSVRVLEAKAREANEPDSPAAARRSRGRAEMHPDQEAAAAEIADALGGALGIEVTVKASGTGYRAEIGFGDPAEALELARRLRRPRAVA